MEWVAELLCDERVGRLKAVLQAYQVPKARSVAQAVSELAIEADKAHGILDLLGEEQRYLDDHTSGDPVTLGLPFA